MTDHPSETPSTTQRQLAQRLRELRHTARLTGDQLAQACGWTQSKVSKIETGRTIPQAADVSAWARAVGATEDVRADLLERAEHALTSVTDWRTALRGGRRAAQEGVAAIEAASSAIRIYQPLIVPGLLQTAEYIRRVFVLGGQAAPDDSLAAAVRARMQRQEILYDDSKHLSFVIGEPALRWRIGPLPMLVGQLDRIVSLIDLPHLEIGVIPWTAEATLLHYAGFTIFGELGRDEQLLVSAETLTEVLRLRDADKVDAYLAHYDKLRAAALFGPDARALITTIGADLRRDAGPPDDQDRY